jgi:hypothetical protein
MPMRDQPGRRRFARWPGLAIHIRTTVDAEAPGPVPQARFSPNAGPRAPLAATRPKKFPCGACGRLELLVDPQRPQVVGRAHAVDGGEQGALLLRQRRRLGGRHEREGEKNDEKDSANMS